MIREFVKDEIAGVKNEISDLRKEVAESKADIVNGCLFFGLVNKVQQLQLSCYS